MKTNVKRKVAPVFNHEGVKAVKFSPLVELRRTVLSCLLWERDFYESGVAIADRIKDLVSKCDPEDVAELAKQARTEYRLRHVPLMLVREMARKGGSIVGRTLADVIQRADEISEFVSLYWKDGRKPLTKQMKIGLANAFNKFDEYQLAKYKGDGKDIKLRDVLFMVHAKPGDAKGRATKAGEISKKGRGRAGHGAYFRGETKRHKNSLLTKLVTDELAIPQTWEVELSAGKDKAKTFTRLINENKLGYMALLRNLRNMEQSGVERSIVVDALKKGAERSKALPFRFISAARAVPSYEAALDEAMLMSTKAMPKLDGTTLILIDVSPSMNNKLSAKSDLSRTDAACGLAVLARELCEDVRVFAFSSVCNEAPARRGMAMIDAVKRAAPSNGTLLGAALRKMNGIKHDRLIVVTDEESQDPVGSPVAKKAYMINVSSAKNGVGYGDWVRVNGFSEAVISFMREIESSGFIAP